MPPAESPPPAAPQAPPTPYRDAPLANRLNPTLVSLRTTRDTVYRLGRAGVVRIDQVMHPVSGLLLYHVVTLRRGAPRIVYDGVEAEIGDPRTRKT